LHHFAIVVEMSGAPFFGPVCDWYAPAIVAGWCVALSAVLSV
jgi:hypothetical protein